MNLIKRHKGLAIVGLLTLILIVIMFIICSRMIFTTGETVYGQRLNGKVNLNKNVIKEIIEETKELKEVEDITIRTQGKIIYTTIIYKEGTKLDKAKEIAVKTLQKYDVEVLAYYDFGYFIKENITNTEEENSKKGFLAAGTKHPDTETISWTKTQVN